MNPAEIEQKAQNILDDFGYDGNDSVEVVELSKRYGFIVGETSFEDDSDGMILVNMKEDTILNLQTQKIILVNRNLDSYFKRFVIAHELGHYFLDGNNGRDDYILAHRDKSIRENDKHEQEIDYFAACLLMPSGIFKQVRDTARILLNETSSSATVALLLSKYFKVPIRSAERRLNEIAKQE